MNTNNNIESGKGQIKNKVTYAAAVYGDEEKKAVLDSLENKWLASGPKVREFEQEVASHYGKKYGIAVNSGSSANLLAMKAVKHFTKDKTWKSVITPACTFSTTISSITINGLKPILVDTVVGRYVANEDEIEVKLKEGKICAILVPQLIGGICDMPKLKALADKYKIFLIDDSCDTFAPKFNKKTVASYADITTTSFYGSHIITAMGTGGMIMTDSEEMKTYITMLRDWGRYGDDREDFEVRFNFKIDGIPYDGKFMYGAEGYNLKMNEGSAAFGLAQLKKLPIFLKTREDNFRALNRFFYKYDRFFVLPRLIDGAETNWLAYPLTIRANAPFRRYDLLKYLEKELIQTRVLFSGNITRHPAYRKYHNAKDKFPDADLIMERGFLLGCHHGMDSESVEYICDAVRRFLDKYIEI